ncbi:beta-1,3-galactosyltransferase 5 [Culex quinquefasciatus]|uniref:beta-1,3-galactosyltransferase 5 n=1 Tax=Culex quinquefasciatus TaxID=7176 RepID=UPI0018E3115E|nr:beta-1,3-galactosyltransferase 5 [Culex quinquefasciatus]
MSASFLQRKLCTATVRVSHVILVIIILAVFVTHTIFVYSRESLEIQSIVVKDAKNQVIPTIKVATKDLYERGHFNDPVTFARICDENGASVNLLVLITSAPSRQDHRMAIRQTWGHFGTRRDVGIGFMLGNSRDPATEEQLSAENLLYGDLIRGHFDDAYLNLTLKTLSMFEWTASHCSGAKYLLKTDDDMFVNVPRLLDFVGEKSGEKRTIYGRLAERWPPVRDENSKYFVSLEEFSPARYPSFTTGPAYLLTADIIPELFSKALEMPFFKMEDVFLTGIVAEQLQIQRVGDSQFLNQRLSTIGSGRCKVKTVISIHDLKPNEFSAVPAAPATAGPLLLPHLLLLLLDHLLPPPLLPSDPPAENTTLTVAPRSGGGGIMTKVTSTSSFFRISSSWDGRTCNKRVKGDGDENFINLPARGFTDGNDDTMLVFR